MPLSLFKNGTPGAQDPEGGLAPDNTKVATAETSVRLGFLRKVYALLTFNFAITIGVSCAFAFIDPVREYIVNNIWVLYAAIAVAIVAFIVLACVRLAYPTNLIMMFVFVAAFSVMIGTIVARFYDNGYGNIVLQAFVATALVFGVITTYVLITKKDFSYLGGFLGCALLILIGLSIVNFALGWTTGGRSRGFSFAISCLGGTSLRLA